MEGIRTLKIKYFVNLAGERKTSLAHDVYVTWIRLQFLKSDVNRLRSHLSDIVTRILWVNI